MSPVTLGALVEAANAHLVSGDPSTAIMGVQYDSRRIEAGDLFVALRGGYADGHDYLSDAMQRGARAALVEDASAATGFEAVAVASNTREVLAPLSARFYGYPGNSLGIVGITGTDGKTTTSYLIDAMLRVNGLRTGLVGTVSIRIADNLVEHDTRQTTPESLEVQRLLADMRDAAVDWAVLEATSHALALYRLNECPFDVGVVTNVTREHLDFHGTVEAYREAKAQLLRKVEAGAGRPYPRGAVVNLDDDGAREIGKSARIPVTWFSKENEDAAIYANSVEVHSGGTAFELKIGGATTRVDLKLIGGYNVFNAMAAAGVGTLLGFGVDEIRRGLESLPHVPGRMQQVDCGQPFNVIVDYAHSPASLKETLKLVRSVTPGRVIVVSGSAGERDAGKRPVQGRICVEYADLAVFTSEDPRFEDPDQVIREIAAGAECAGAERGRDFTMIENRRAAIERALAAAGDGDSVVLAGKGHETCMIYGSERVSWNEAEEAKEALRGLGFNENPRDAEG